MRRLFSYDQEITRAKKMQKQSLLLMLVILAISLLPGLSLLRSNTDSFIRFTEDSIQFHQPDAASAESLLYNDIFDVSLQKDISYGTCISGGKEDSYYYGTWENELFGQYKLFCHEDISSIICLTSSEGTYVINYQSEDTTTEIYEFLLESILGAESAQ